MRLPQLPHLAFFLFMLLCPSLMAGDFTETITFSPQDVKTIQSQGFDFIEMSEGALTGETGAPALPKFEYSVALPWNAELQGLTLLKVRTVELDGTFRVAPMTAPRIISDRETEENPFQIDPLIYGRDAFYPGYYQEEPNTWDLVGQRCATFVLHPLQYNPVTGKLLLATEIEVQVIWGEAAEPPERTTFNLTEAGRAHYDKMLKKHTLNPDAVDIPLFTGSGSRALPAGQYEYVIITTDYLKSYWTQLADWRTRIGFKCNVVTKEYIYANYAAPNNYGKIRSFVEQAHSAWGTRYFLIGADGGNTITQVPYHTRTINGTGIPNDTYYADYDADWHVEVNVGRASVTSWTHITNFINKVLYYERTPSSSDYAEKVFFMGFDLDGSTDGEEVKKDIDAFDIPSYINLLKEYDSESGGHKTDVTNYLNGGPNLVNHIDHCNWDLWGIGSVNHNTYYVSTNVNALTNGWELINMYSLGCLASAWDYGTSLSEIFMRKSNGAGVSFTGNTRNGWYNPGYYNTLSNKYDRRWWHVLFTDNAYRVGETLTEHKNDFYPSGDTERYIFTELNLLGDPVMPLWKNDPVALTATHISTLGTGSQSFNVNVKRGGANLNGASVCLWKGDEVYEVSTTNSSGNKTFTIDPTTSGTLFVTATYQDCIPYEGDANVTSSGPPSLTGVTPGDGGSAGGTICTVSGSNFTDTADTTVTFGGTPVGNLNVVNSSILTCIAPAHSAGTVSIALTNSNGSDTLANAFTYHSAPNVTAINPTSGTVMGATHVTLSGSNFDAQANTNVTFGGAAASLVNVVNANTITCYTPAHSEGPVNVVVSSDYGADTLNNGYTYSTAPVVGEIVPNQGPSVGGTTVTINGNYFTTSPDTAVTFGGVSATNVNVLTTMSLVCKTPAHTMGIVDVKVTNSNGTGTLANGFGYISGPYINWVFPENGPIIGGTTVSIQGSNFTTSFDTTVTFGGHTASNVTVLNFANLTCVAPAHASGPVDVILSNGNGSALMSGAFTYDYPPEIWQVIPDEGHAAGNTAITIYGTNFTSTFEVALGGSLAGSLNVVDYGTINCNTPSHSGGLVDLSATSVNGTGSLVNGFFYHNPPSIASVVPDNGPMTGTTLITLSGSGFTSTADTVVTFDGAAAIAVSVLNSDTIACRTPPSASSGAVDVYVENTWGSHTLANSFSYNPPPAITGVSPSKALMQTATPITLTGNYFLPSFDTEVFIGGLQASGVVVVNTTTITCYTPENPIPDFEDVEIFNSNGSGLLADGMEFIPTSGGLPMNLADVDTLNVYPGETVRFSVTGPPDALHAVFLSLGGGPVFTDWGYMGLDLPMQHMYTTKLNGNGYQTVSFEITDPQVGFITFYIHAIVDNNPPIWATGGNNPNGTGSMQWGLHSSN